MKHEPTDGFTDEAVQVWKTRPDHSLTQEEVGYLLDEIERLRKSITSAIEVIHGEHQDGMVFFSRAKAAEEKLMKIMGITEYFDWVQQGKP